MSRIPKRRVQIDNRIEGMAAADPVIHSLPGRLANWAGEPHALLRKESCADDHSSRGRWTARSFMEMSASTYI